MGDRRPKPAPKGLKAPGRRLWRAVVGTYDLESHEELLLEQACHVADACADLQDAVDTGPLIADDRAAPALVELRQQRLLLGRLLAALRVPGEDVARPPQRRALRGVYTPGGAA
jgi:hypothetical protein